MGLIPLTEKALDSGGSHNNNLKLLSVDCSKSLEYAYGDFQEFPCKNIQIGALRAEKTLFSNWKHRKTQFAKYSSKKVTQCRKTQKRPAPKNVFS